MIFHTGLKHPNSPSRNPPLPLPDLLNWILMSSVPLMLSPSTGLLFPWDTAISDSSCSLSWRTLFSNWSLESSLTLVNTVVVMGLFMPSVSSVCTTPLSCSSLRSLGEGWLPTGGSSSCSPLEVLFSLKGKCGEEEQLRCSWGSAIVPWVCLRPWDDTQRIIWIESWCKRGLHNLGEQEEDMRSPFLQSSTPHFCLE